MEGRAHTAWGSRRQWDTTVSCRHCGKDLTMYRGCTSVTLRCPACQASYPLAEAAPEITEEMEEDLAFVPLDRL